MFTLSDYIVFGVVAAVMVGIIGMTAVCEVGRIIKIVAIVVEISLFVSLVVGCAAYNTHTESGKRHVKTWESETSGGINRTVTVYDIQGEEVAKYSGRFDIEESSQEGVVKIKFDNNGKRHIIYAQTGTVLIDEN